MAGSDGQFVYNNNGSADGAEVYYDSSTSNFGVGTDSPGEKLEVAGIVFSTSGGFKFPDGSTQTTAAAGGSSFWSQTGSDIYYNAGKVGIGTTTPGEELEVNGNIKVNGVVAVTLPKTGQTFSYQAGDDGTYQKGQDVLVDNGDGTVTDIRTGLMWPKDGIGSGYASGGTKTWNEAIDWTEGLNFAEHDDWRLPNINELKSFQEVTWGYYQNQPTGYYWSSTTYAGRTSYAMGVGFSSGGAANSNKTNSNYVVAVRGGL